MPDTSKTSMTRVTRLQHERHECNTSGTSLTPLQHKQQKRSAIATGTTLAALVRHEYKMLILITTQLKNVF